MPPFHKLFAALALVFALGGCDHFLAPEAPAEASGPIATGFARIRIENTGDVTVRETWYASCLGGQDVLKVRRRIAPGESTQQDVRAGCVRLTLYPDAGAFYITVVANEGEVTVVQL